MDKLRCQSCGMPLSEDYFGSNDDGSANKVYCKFCFQDGNFTEPNLKLESMIDRSVKHMMSELFLSEELARDLANRVIPHLTRWKNAP